MIRILIAWAVIAQSMAFGQTFQEHCENSANLPPAQQEFIRVVVKRTYSDCATVQERVNKTGELYIGGEKLTDIALITSIKGIKKLNLADSHISDVKPLAALEGIESLNLSENMISDVSALAKLAKLTSLDLSENQLQNLEPLKAITSLQNLYLDDNPILDFGPLSGLVNLQKLRVGSQFWDSPRHCAHEKFSREDDRVAASLDEIIANFTNLQLFASNGINFRSTANFEKLKQLNFLAIKCASIEKTKVLAALPKLVNLYLDNNRLSQIEPLSNPKPFETLSLAGNMLKNAEVLASFTDIEWIDLARNALAGEFALKSFDSLRRLKIERNALKYVDLQGDFPNLGYINVSYNQIKHVHFANTHNKLYAFSARNNQLIDPSAGMNLDEVHLLDLAHNHIRDFTFINAIKLDERTPRFSISVGGNLSNDFSTITHPRLREFEARGSELADLANLPNIDSISYLDIGDNFFQDLKGLDKMYPYLDHLTADGNPLSDGEHLTALEGLNELDLSRTHIASFDFLSKFRRLTRLSLKGNRIADIAFLKPLWDVYYLDLSQNSISDLSVFASGAFMNMSSINLDSNLIADATPLGRLDDLWSKGALQLGNNPLGTTVGKTSDNCPTNSANKYLTLWCKQP